MKVKIERIRYAVVRTRDNAIFCGEARNYRFEKISNDLGCAIKTYLSKKKAIASLYSSWGIDEEDFTNGYYKVVKVKESIIEVEE